MSSTLLSVRNVHKRFGAEIHAVRDVSLDVAQGEVLALLGPSGCGKTTLLRLIAGLEEMDAGELRLEGRDLSRIPIHRRNFGFMFQDFALFPHQTVAENIAFGLRMRNDAAASIRAGVDEMLELVNLPGYGQRSIFELSGGERQRVALARSLAPNPRLLLLDEPLGSLDRTLRESLALELHTILREIGVTTIYVTHDQQEAFVLSDRLAIMRAGEIEQLGAPEAVYRRPATEFVARFLGFRNLIPVTGVAENNCLQTNLGALPVSPNQTQAELDAARAGRAALLIRPESARLVQNDAELTNIPAGRMILRGTLVSCAFLGVEYRIAVDVIGVEDARDNATNTPRNALPRTPKAEDGCRLYFDLPSHQIDMRTGILAPASMPAVGQPVSLFLFPDLMSLIPTSQATIPNTDSD